MAKSHGRAESFRLEIIRTNLVGASRDWCVDGKFTSRSSFVDRLSNNFIGQAIQTVDRVRITSNRVQQKTV